MKTALCLTPDRRFFEPAICAATSVFEHADSGALDVFIICEAADVPEGFDRLDTAIRSRIHLQIVDFAAYDRGMASKGRFSRAVFRRLFLDRILPNEYTRIVTFDSDMLALRPGLGKLATIDLRGKAFAAAIDMIFLMDFAENTLARQFRRSRAELGLDVDTPYFNAGLLVIDRDKWTERKIGETIAHAMRSEPEKYAFMEQDALNALVKGDFAPLSPRYNFMGDFFLLDLEATLKPIVVHFVNAPKPWDFGLWRGELRYQREYWRRLSATPWPPLAPEPSGASRKPRSTPQRRAFAERLTGFLLAQDFIDAPKFRDEAPDLTLVFEHIHAANRWGSRESVSGPGSTLDYTQNLRARLPEILHRLGIKRFFDAPCGDFNWMQALKTPSGFSYLGGDIAPSVVADNQARHAQLGRDFRVFDVTRDPFPIVDLWFCRDCLFHLPEALVFAALENFASSNIPYAMLTTHRTTSEHRNVDIAAGEFRLLDLFKSPYCLPRDVIGRFDDWKTPFPEREMCVWTRDQIVEALNRRGKSGSSGSIPRRASAIR